MYNRPNFDRVFITSELHPQHSGNMQNAYAMIMQSHMAGADAVKVQLYDTQKLHGDKLREYVQLTKEELRDLKAYADHIGIELYASVFDLERIEWCEELDFKYYKVASRSVDDRDLCQAMIDIGKPVFIALGMYDWQEKGLPYEGDNLTYFYCVAQYPTFLEDVKMPEFSSDYIAGYSDHTLGISACVYAVAHGAQYLEKHFTLNKSGQFSTEKAHAGAMDFDELRQLRQFSDSISILRAAKE